MSTPSSDDAPLNGSPYRVTLPLPVPPPQSSRGLLFASYALSACALFATLTSLHVACTLTRLVSMSRAPAVHAAPYVPVARAVEAPPPSVREQAPPGVPGHLPAPYGIRSVGRGVYVVSRHSLDDALSSPSSLVRGARIIPENRGGHVVGVRVFGIREGDLLDVLGLADGDVVLRVNGFDLASPDHCLEAYTSLRATDRITLDFERDGQTHSNIYALVPEAG